MNMRNLMLPLLLFVVTVASAQTIVKGDMNSDEQVTISDVTSLVNVILGKSPMETIDVGGKPYGVDNSMVVGTWYTPEGSSFTLNEDGTTDYGEGYTFRFRPYQGTLMMFNAQGLPVRTIVLNEVEEDYLLAVDYASQTYMKYTKKPTAVSTHLYVDLGLPSGTLWASCNVGATSPEDFGDYFAWGETEVKTNYDWSTYKYCKGAQNTLTKYCQNSSNGYNSFTDELTELEPADDAASVRWGSEWRTPSEEQFGELLNSDYTTAVWMMLNSVYGLKITSKKNGNYIFLPAAGMFNGMVFQNAGSTGSYMTRTLASSPSLAWRLNFGISSFGMNSTGRNYGQPIRPVK